MLRRYTEHFLKKPVWEKLGISEMKYLKNYFFYFYIYSVCIYETPFLYFIFSW